jgi:hypothetical protein
VETRARPLIWDRNGEAYSAIAETTLGKNRYYPVVEQLSDWVLRSEWKLERPRRLSTAGSVPSRPSASAFTSAPDDFLVQIFPKAREMAMWLRSYRGVPCRPPPSLPLPVTTDGPINPEHVRGSRFRQLTGGGTRAI